MEFYYSSSDARWMCQGLQTITDYKGKPSRELPSDASPPDKQIPSILALSQAILNYA